MHCCRALTLALAKLSCSLWPKRPGRLVLLITDTLLDLLTTEDQCIKFFQTDAWNVDDFGEGNPIVFLQQGKYKLTMSLFFRAIKTHLLSDTEYSASHVTTDDTGQYYNALAAVWHISQVSQQFLNDT